MKLRKCLCLLCLALIMVLLCCASEASDFVPRLQLGLDTPANGDHVYYYFGLPANDPHYESWTNWSEPMIRIYVEDWNRMETAYGDTDTWRMTQTEGPALDVTGQVDAENFHPYAIVFNQYPTQPLDATFRIECSWGGQTAFKTVYFHAVDVSGNLPANLDQPLRITGARGDTVSLSITDDVLSGWQDDGVIMYGWSLDLGNDVASMRGWNLDDQVCLYLDQAGTATGQLMVRKGTMIISKTIEITVAGNGSTAANLHIRPRDLNFYIGIDNYDNSDVNYYNQTTLAWMENYWDIANTLSGDPQWSARQVSGDPLGASFESYSNDSINIELNHIPDHPVEAGMEITVNWDGVTVTVPMTVHVKYAANGLPTGFDPDTMPDVIEAQVGQQYTFAPKMLPANWSLPGHETELLFNGGDIEQFGVFFNPTRDTAVITPNTPGIYHITATLATDTIAVFREITVQVKDEYGHLPTPTLTLRSGNPELNRYIGVNSDDFDDAWSWNLINDVEVENWQEMRSYYGGSPTWKVERVSGVDFPFTYDEEDFGTWGRVDVRCEDIGQVTGDTVMKYTCEWGGQTAEVTSTIHILNMDHGAPRGLDYPRVIDTQVGQTVTIAPTILPAGWSLYNYTPALTFNSGEMEEFSDLISQTDTQAQFKMTKAGIYKALVMMGADTVTIGHEVTFRVKDANGDLPKPILRVEDYGYTEDRAYIGMPMYYSGLGADNEVSAYGMMPWFQYSIDNYDELVNYYGGGPQWNVTQTAGTQLQIDCWPDLWDTNGRSEYYYSMEIQEAPSAPTVAEWDLTCTWGDQTDTKHVKVEFLKSPNGAPQDTDYPATVNLQVGDTLVIEPHILPANWTLPGVTPRVHVFDEQLEAFATKDEQNSTSTHLEYTVTEPGYYNATILLSYEGRINAGHETLFKVKDANGTLPPMELDITCNQGSFERDFCIGMDFEAHTFYTGKVQTDPQITYFYLDNAYLYSRMLQGDPVWKATRKQGTANVSIEDNGVDGMNLDIISLPASPEDAVYLIECDWDGVHWEEEYTVHFKNSPVGLPTGLEVDFGDHLIVRTGEEIKLRDNVRFKNGWRISGEDYSVPLGGDGNIWDGVNGWDSYYGNQPGIYQANVSAMSANVRWIEDFTLIVTRADGTLPVSARPAPATLIRLPANTQRIEAQAFAGSPIGSIDIPAGVTFIADDAFDGCGLVYAYCHSQYAIDYAVSHGLVALVD